MKWVRQRKTHAWYPFYVESKKVIISLFLLFLMVWQEVLQSSTMWRWWWFSPSVVSDSCDSVDCSLPGSSVHGILQARILEWIAISFPRGSSWPRDRTWLSCTAGKRFTIWAIRESQGDLMLEASAAILWSWGQKQENHWRLIQSSTFTEPVQEYLDCCFQISMW